MSTLRERMEFAPPPSPGLVRAMLLAIMAHGILLAVLAVGVQWKREAPPITVEAELWSALPVEAAAPAAEEPPPEPEPPQPPEPAPVVQPPPVVAPPVPVPPQVDIALAKEKEKAKLLKETQLQQEKAEQEKKKLALEKEKLLKEKQTKEKLAKDKAEKEKQDKLARDKKAQQDQSAQKADKAKALAEDKKREEVRQQALKRMTELAGSGGSGQPGSTSTATQSSGPSASYAGRVAARIKPKMVYTQTIVGNPRVEIDVSASPDGTIISRRIRKSSGTPSWDDAVLNAVDKMAVLPKDESGRVPTPMTIIYSAQDMLGN